MSQLHFPDEIPVSEEEVQIWLDTVPNLSASKFRREAYRKAYNVEAKIRNIKLGLTYGKEPAAQQPAYILLALHGHMDMQRAQHGQI